MELVYTIPIIVSMLLHIALHHNVIYEASWPHIAGLIVSILSPLLYMISCAESQLAYFPKQFYLRLRGLSLKNDDVQISTTSSIGKFQLA